MQTIGERLEEARKRKGVSVREAAEITKIRGDYLQKFEANAFDIDLPPLYIRGFLRAYARYLELDPERIVNDYNAAPAGEGKSGRRENREVFGRVDFGDAARSPEAGEAAPAGRSAQDQALLLKFGLLGGGALVAVIAIILLVKVLFSSGTPAKPAVAQPQAVAQPAQTAADSRENSLTLIARGPVRVKVVRLSDNQVLFPGLVPMTPGETKLIRYSSNLKVTVDDPSKLSIEINGQRKEVPIKEYGYFTITTD
jgi:cytoskeletal protein RodZ